MMINQQIKGLIRGEEAILRYRRRNMFDASDTRQTVSNIRGMMVARHFIHRWEKDLTNKEDYKRPY